MEQQLLQILKQVLREESLSDEDLTFLENWSAKSRENAEWLSRVRIGDLPFTDIIFIEENEAKLGTLFNEFWKRLAVTPAAELKSAANSLPGTLDSQVAAPVHRVHFLRTAWFRYAAAVLLIAATATYWYLRKEGGQKDIAKQYATLNTTDLPAGGNKAVLTLSDGSTIILDSAANGVVASQGTTRVIKLANGSVAYQAKPATAAIGFNTISTPQGGQYQVSLPDGSKVWLNAASSIRFPTVFATDRKVSITGEAYFEIEADKNKPFYVSANSVEVQVLGTRFNLNSYGDKGHIETTLFEGSVSVAATAGGNRLLKPGQQALVALAPTDSGIELINNADTEQVMAWKNGVFKFDNLDFQQVMKQLERWYSIQVKYEGPVPLIRLTGKMDRAVRLSGVLRFLTEYGIKVRLQDRILVISGS